VGILEWITGKRESGQHDPSYNLRLIGWDVYLAHALKLNWLSEFGGYNLNFGSINQILYE